MIRKNLYVSKTIGYILNRMLPVYPHAKAFFPNGETSTQVMTEISERSKNNYLYSAIFKDKVMGEIAASKMPLGEYTFEVHEYFQNTMMPDAFHFSFGSYVHEVGEDNRITDNMMHYRASENDTNRKAPDHIIGVEQLLRATKVGCYFAAIIPERSNMTAKYARWFNDNCGLVATIKLPSESILKLHTSNRPAMDSEVVMLNRRMATTKPRMNGSYNLMVWFKHLKPDDEQSYRGKIQHMEHARFHYNTFQYTLNDFKPSSIDDMIDRFKADDWYNFSILHQHDMLFSMSETDSHGTYDMKPMKIPSAEDQFFFEPRKGNSHEIMVVDDVGKIKAMKMAAHIKLGSRIRISTYTEAASNAMVNLKVGMYDSIIDNEFGKGIEFNRDIGEYEWRFDKSMSNLNFSEARQSLLSKLANYNLTPVMTKQQHRQMVKSERRIDIQLTPISRWVLPKHVSIDKIAEADSWVRTFEDNDMRAAYPEIIHMWRQRALKMKMDKYLFKFQFEDVIIQAAKRSILNANTMGLGKTRESIFLKLLLCAEKMLIICPSKLIGEWEDQIRDTVVPYIQFVRKNWQGKVIKQTVQVIEYGEQLLPHNLKMFNIVSTDKLKTTPRDGRFYKCPKSGFICFRRPGPHRDDPMQSFGNPMTSRSLIYNDPITQEIIDYNKKRLEIDINTGKLVHRKFKVDPETNKEIYWNSPSSLPSKLIDTRIDKPEPVMMLQLNDVYKKVIQQVTKVNEETGEPSIVQYPRDQHVAWTFANLCRNRFKHIILDEALDIANQGTKRSNAVNHVNGAKKSALTGTPMKGMPQTILGIINWTFPSEIMPEYRAHDKEGRTRFLDKYRVDVTITKEDGSTTQKQVPKINNPTQFQNEMAPLMVRHIRTEPEVEKDIPHIPQVLEDIRVPMDRHHRDYYQRWIDQFIIWWETMKEEEEGKKKRGNVLAKLGYLRKAASIPHFMFDTIKNVKPRNMDEEDDVNDFRKWMEIIGPYKHKKPVAKILRARELVVDSIKANDKAIVFSYYRKNSLLGKHWADKLGIGSMIVDGSTSLSIKKSTGRSPRHELVQQFRHIKNNQVMWAGLTALAEGMNIPEANRGILVDTEWRPDKPWQAIGRMLRPQQTKTVWTQIVMHEGTVEEYMAALCHLRGKSGQEGIDYMEFDDFSTDIIPDFAQYAESIVTGDEAKLKSRMWLAVEEVKNKFKRGDDE